MPDAHTVFTAVDSLDSRVMIALFAEDGTMVFGNREPMRGREAIVAGVEAFLSTIRGLRHDIRREWTVGADTIAETDVTYTRHDDKRVTIPAVSIWRVRDDGLITDYRVFYDPSPLFAA
ncbi:nuclear transport factor 2 family protein [Pseudonocardia acaciae]|uniref:nuclear transport factor 2 family protein n=1 Tax=Pseudonocardia acaciae TaxID=551276 RepID=UPI00049085FE|nr:nuclear transport factor 2 family protein [Pseudonocardia acaciae]